MNTRTLETRKYILGIDQGTTSTKALVIDQGGTILGSSSPERFGIEASYPQPGWVEFDPDRILDTVHQSAQAAVRNAGISFTEIAGIGLANQGETVIAFDGASGRPICPAISWQDRRSEEITQRWRTGGMEETIFATTGLRLDIGECPRGTRASGSRAIALWNKRCLVTLATDRRTSVHH